MIDLVLPSQKPKSTHNPVKNSFNLFFEKKYQNNILIVFKK